MPPTMTTVRTDQDLARVVAELQRELAEAREQQAASAEALRIISATAADLEGVCAAMATSAARLCEAHDVAIHRLDGDALRLVAQHGPIPATATMPLIRGMVAARAVIDQSTVHVADLQAETNEYPEGSDRARRMGLRTVLAVPLMRANKAIGGITMRRMEVRPFTDRQIELLKVFADQAVIAMENARLFEAEQASKRELAESLQQQTATAEVLKTISRSALDLQSVLDALVASAAHLCDAPMVAIHVQRDAHLPGRARYGFTAQMVEGLSKISQVMGRGSLAGRTLVEGHPVHIPDVDADREYTFRDFTRITGARSMLGVPLLRDGKPAGLLSLYRRRVAPFTPRQIELVATFADQAVIAIENARLFEAEEASKRELQESLEYQTAISEVLGVISSSPNKLQPVLDAIASTACKLCQADHATIFKVHNGSCHIEASRADPALIQYLRDHPIPVDGGFVTSRAVRERRVVQKDALTDTDYASLFELHKSRTLLAAPLLRDGIAIGVITIGRYAALPFTKSHINLIETFADQAVIAIENTRLFEEVQARTRELQESLEYQTAAGDVLQVISSSPGQLQPVYDTILARALRHCDAKFGGLFRYEKSAFQGVASVGIPQGLLIGIEEGAGSSTANSELKGLIESRQPLHSPDLRQNASYLAGDPFIVGAVDRGGARAALLVPLLKENELIGALAIYRREVRPFTDKQVQLVQTFADQAVIAIENARLFEAEQASKRELQEALEFQTATSEVLNVISRSPSQLQPVFDFIAQSASRLCGDNHAIVTRYDGTLLHMAAQFNPRPGIAEEQAKFYPRVPQVGTSISGRAFVRAALVHIPDIDAEQWEPSAREGYRRMGLRAAVAVPMMHEGRPIGVIGVSRGTPGPFSDRQIQLLRTFADQAVIAIQNTRLFEEVQARTAELTVALERQMAMSEILGIISASPGKLEPVFDAILARARELCAARFGHLLLLDGHTWRPAALHNVPKAYEEYWHSAPAVGLPGTLLWHLRERKQAFLLEDARLGEAYRARIPLAVATVELGGARTLLGVPLLKDGQVIGAIVLYRTEVHPFDDQQIALLSGFAEQAVIAIENTRLFEEVQARTRELAKTVEELELASQHKSQFVANMSHELRTPLAAILGYAELMQEGFYGQLSDKSLDALTRIRSNGKHLLGLINTVLDIAKIESGQFKLNLGEYALDSVVETVRAATESLAETKKLAFKTEVGSRLPIGLGDEQRLTQVLLNIVGNAIKFTDAGEVCVSARATSAHFAVSVADTGPGIPEGERQRIFEQFHQVDSSNTKAKGGTGLGLAIAKQIVEMHGGRIWVESAVGKGSTFLMELPIRAETDHGLTS